MPLECKAPDLTETARAGGGGAATSPADGFTSDFFSADPRLHVASPPPLPPSVAWEVQTGRFCLVLSFGEGEISERLADTSRGWLRRELGCIPKCCMAGGTLPLHACLAGKSQQIKGQAWQ